MANFLEDAWNAFYNWANQNSEHYIEEQIPKERTDLTGPEVPLAPFRDYMRLWLDDMFLAMGKQWFVDRFPAVHTSVELKFGGNPVKITHVTDGTAQAGPGLFQSYALTDLVPFNGGIVRVQSGLLSLKGTNHAAQAIGILKDFSSLVGAPLNQTLSIAEKVGTGVQGLLQSGGGEVTLGFHREYASAGGGGGSELKPGYTALVLANKNQVSPERLSVKKGHLLYAKKPGADPEPLYGYDYMLLRLEGRRERDDWRMPNIEEPLNQAIQATLQGEQDKADGFLKAALLVVWQSPDLAVQDRRRVADAIKAEVADVSGQPHGAEGVAVRTLTEVMKSRSMKVERAMAEPALSLQEILGG